MSNKFDVTPQDSKMEYDLGTLLCTVQQKTNLRPDQPQIGYVYRDNAGAHRIATFTLTDRTVVGDAHKIGARGWECAGALWVRIEDLGAAVWAWDAERPSLPTLNLNRKGK